MSDESVVNGIISAGDLETWAKTLNASASGMDSPLVREARVHFDGDGVHVSAVDAANVAMFENTTLAPRAFEAYTAPGKATIGLALDTFLDRLGPADSAQLVEFNINMETRHLELTYGATEMTVALIDPEAIRSEPDTPDLDLPNEATIEGGDLRHAVEVAQMLGGHVTVIADPDARELRFSGQGDTDDATVTYGDEDLIDASVGEATESVFSADYLDAITSPIPDDAEVRLRFGEAFPMRLSWETFDGAFEVSQLVAPRIQSR